MTVVSGGIQVKVEDAAKVLGLSGELTKELIKKAYRVACSKYHPDKGGSLEMMQAVNKAYEVLKDYEGVVKSGDVDYGELLNAAYSTEDDHRRQLNVITFSS